jgi:hypothetical protein
MNFLMNVMAAIFRIALKLLLLGFAVAVAFCLLLVGLASLVWVLLKALLTGRKPAFVVTLQRFQQARRQFQRGGGRFTDAPGARRGDDVVDVMDAKVVEVEVADLEAKPLQAPPALPPVRDSDRP